MDIQYLREFVVLEEICNYSRAADALYTTEATLSRHIRALEKEVGQALFLRTTRRVELTAFGTKFLVYAKKIVATMDECETNLLKKDAGLGDRLIIGIFGLISRYATIQEALRSFSTMYPNCTVGTIQGDLGTLKEKLLKKEYDLAIVRESAAEAEDEFGRINIMREPLCLVLPKNDVLAREKEIEVSQLKGRNIIVPSEFMLSHKLFVELCRQNNFEPKVRAILREREFLENFVSIGNEITVLCDNMARRAANPDTQVIKQIAPTTCECVNLLYRKTGTQSELIQHAIRCFQKVSEKS